MYFKRLESTGLSHFSYILGSGNEAIVIDPRRDIDTYLSKCTKHGFTIKYIFETHRNEDFVIGSLELKNLIPTVEIYHGENLPYEYGLKLKDNQEFEFGDCKVKAIHTPGHTLGSFSYVIHGEDMGDLPHFVFTGDLLFAGDTGRTDFFGKDRQAELSGMQFDSIHERIIPLGDEIILCPGHGAGSVCGSGIKKRQPTTIGIERKLTPLLQLSRQEYIETKISEHHSYAPYFQRMEEYNLGHAPLLYQRKFPQAMSFEQIEALQKENVQLVDCRKPPAYGGAHIKNSYSIWLDGLSSFAGWFLDYTKPIVLILEKREDLDTALVYLARVGYDNVIGYIFGGFLSWYKNARPLTHTEVVSVHSLKQKLDSAEKMQLLDVRSVDERLEGYIPNSLHTYVGDLPNQFDKLPRDIPLILYCAVGLRATIAASYLEQQGFSNLKIFLGSYSAWEQAGYRIEK